MITDGGAASRQWISARCTGSMLRQSTEVGAARFAGSALVS